MTPSGFWKSSNVYYSVGTKKPVTSWELSLALHFENVPHLEPYLLECTNVVVILIVLRTIPIVGMKWPTHQILDEIHIITMHLDNALLCCKIFIPSYTFDALVCCKIFIPRYTFDALLCCKIFIPSYTFDALLCWKNFIPRYTFDALLCCKFFIPRYTFDGLLCCKIFIPRYTFDGLLCCKIFIPSYAFDALLCCNLLFLPPSRQTLSITLIRTRCIAIHSEISPCAKRIYYSLQNSCTATTMGRLQRQQTWYALT